LTLNDQLLALVKDPDAKGIFCDYAEVALDAALDPGILKDIPIAGTLLSVGNLALTIKDRIFLRKVSGFLNGLRDIPKGRTEQFLMELEQQGIRERVGEKLLLLLDRQEELDKALWLGILFSAYIRGDIDRHDFELLAHSVTAAFLGDIEHIAIFLGDVPLPADGLGAALFSYGLADMDVRVTSSERLDYDAEEGEFPATQHYTLNRYGELLARITQPYGI
jgi:hypothetical protein